MEYTPDKIEKKWQNIWAKEQTYKAVIDPAKPKFYILDMFPYPSGAGLHVGHPLGYFATDIYARYKRMSGYNVLHPMGFDAFGLPAEQYAIQTGVHPAISTEKNIEKYREQLRSLGFDYDWEREVKTCDPSYYKWTQWIFIQLFEHYYDTTADKALPISKLTAQFEKAGNAHVTAHHAESRTFSANEWHSFSPIQKAEILMNYRLAYKKVAYVNWCEALGTVLANDEVKDGLSERGGHPVEKRAMEQWALRITAYANRLLSDLADLDWPEPLKLMQRNWIGKSEGARVTFQVDGQDIAIDIYTTRPDTIYGASFMVLAPEHEYISRLTSSQQKSDIEQYLKYVASRSDRERMSDVKKVTGAFTGSYAVHPFSGEKLPIWTSEYVLKDYGSGAIMAVPADDLRDRAFAEKFGLPIIDVVDRTEFPGAGPEDKVGKMINSGPLTGMDVKEAIQHAIMLLEKSKLGHREVNFKLRDANYSRQRYWGEPFPIVYDRDGLASPVPVEELPVELPELDNFLPTKEGKSPLARLSDWVNVDPNKRRETDTMPGFAGSSWYFLRYMDPDNSERFASPEAIDYWKDVDFYVGGTEHAVGHLLYARFWHKFLYDMALVPTSEPFRRLINQGMIQGTIESIFMKKESEAGQKTFVCASLVDEESEDEYIKIPVHIEFVKDYGTAGSYLDAGGLKQFTEWRPEFEKAEFVMPGGRFHLGTFTPSAQGAECRLVTHSEVGKMSKSKYNVINPDEVVGKYGADCFRMYEMFLGPIEQAKPWDTKGIDGVAKFLKRFWALCHDEQGNFVLDESDAGPEELKILHLTIKRVTEDIDRFSLNTCISHFMICVNELRKLPVAKRQIMEPLMQLIAPFAPHMAEELWHLAGHSSSVHKSVYPVFHEKYLQEATIEYPISINGKKRSTAHFASDATREELERLALELEEVQKWTEGNVVKKVIVVPGRMINIVV